MHAAGVWGRLRQQLLLFKEMRGCGSHDWSPTVLHMLNNPALHCPQRCLDSNWVVTSTMCTWNLSFSKQLLWQQIHSCECHSSSTCSHLLPHSCACQPY